MVRVLESRLKGMGLSPGQGHWVVLLCSWARHFTFTVALSTQEYKWVVTITV